MEINKEIEEKAKDIIVQKHKEQEQEQEVKDYIQLCIEAGICPVCGKEIYLDWRSIGERSRGIYICKCGWVESTTM